MEKKYKLHEDTPKQFAIDYAKELNGIQQSIVVDTEGPCLIIAGPGSGKTRVLVYRVAYLLEKGVKPERIMLVTFTNKAAREMLFRVETLLGFYPKGIFGGTFHHLTNLLLRRHGKLIGYQPNFTILDEDESVSLLKDLIEEAGIDTKQHLFPKPAIIKEIISFARNSMQKIETVIEKKYEYFVRIQGDLIAIANYYKKTKEKMNLMDFDDLLINAVRLLKEHPELRERVSNTLQYVLVDEFQDTSKVQAEFIYLLSEAHKNITVVGDDCQSIYSFRAATVENILEFPKRLAGAKILKLEENYRSSSPIVSMTNNVLHHIVNKFEKNLYTEKQSSELPKFVRTRDAQDQAKFIGQRILELREDSGISLNQIAILFRSSFHALDIELLLNKMGIPYAKRGGLKFFEQAHVKDTLAFLKILVNPLDQVAWFRLLHMFPGIGRKTALTVWEKVIAVTPLADLLKMDLNTVKVSANAKNGLKKLFDILKAIHEEKNTSAMIKKIFEEFYKDYIVFNFKEPEDRINDIRAMINFSSIFETVQAFVAQATLDENFKGESLGGYEEGEQERVMLTTIHQAKGLEWKVVFVIHANEGHFPHARSLRSEAELDEERRLFYVAISRAKDLLYVTHFESYKDYKGYTVFAQPSRFLEELSSDCYEVWAVS